MEHVEVAGVRSPVIDTGPSSSITAVVLVHGNPGEGTDWQPLMDEVSRFGRCIAPDMPGYGHADKPADFPYTTDGYARHLGGVIDELGVTRVHLVAHDLGVAWGLAWAASRPELLASLTLIDLGALPGYRWHRYARTYRRPLLGELLLLLAYRSAVVDALRAGTKKDVPRDFVDRALRGYRDGGTRRAILRYYRATDLASDTVRAAEALRDADPPTLVVWGGGDPYVPVSFAEEQLRYFPGARVVVLPESGHWPFLDDPTGFAAVVVPFLRQQLASGY